MLSLDKVFNAQTVLKSIIRKTKLVRAYGIASECELYLKPENLQITEGAGAVADCGGYVQQIRSEKQACGCRCVGW